jgi:hypothetical protein
MIVPTIDNLPSLGRRRIDVPFDVSAADLSKAELLLSLPTNALEFDQSLDLVPTPSLSDLLFNRLVIEPSAFWFSQSSGSLVSRGTIIAGDGGYPNGNGGDLWLVDYPTLMFILALMK